MGNRRGLSERRLRRWEEGGCAAPIIGQLDRDYVSDNLSVRGSALAIKSVLERAVGCLEIRIRHSRLEIQEHERIGLLKRLPNYSNYFQACKRLTRLGDLELLELRASEFKAKRSLVYWRYLTRKNNLDLLQPRKLILHVASTRNSCILHIL